MVKLDPGPRMNLPSRSASTVSSLAGTMRMKASRPPLTVMLVAFAKPIWTTSWLDQEAQLLPGASVSIQAEAAHRSPSVRSVQPAKPLLSHHEHLPHHRGGARSAFLNRLAAPVRSRSAAKGDSTTLVVRMCTRCSFG